MSRDMEEQEYIEQERNIQQQNINLAQNRLEVEQSNMGMMMQDQDRNIVQEQLSLKDELKKIENLLRGRVQIIGDDGQPAWEEPESNDDIILSEQGVNLILSTIQWYLNKNTLLSNYDNELINRKMEDFSTSLADAIFMKYEKYFLYPTTEECQNILIERIKKKIENEIYNVELRGGEPVNEKELYIKFVNEIDPTRERLKIKEQLIKDKLKGFDLLMRQIQDAVHSTYLRALFGAERRTLRQHIHISESRNQNNSSPQDKGNPFSIFKRKN